MLDGDAVTLIAWQNGRPVIKNGLVATEQACCCQRCGGPCETSADCPSGCVCDDGQCVSPCCFSGINCDIVVTVTYSNGQTRTNGQNEITQYGDDFLFEFVGYEIIDCNKVRYTHPEIGWAGPGQLFPCYQIAQKVQSIDCTTCCDDATACDCTLGAVVAENYAPIASGVECSDEPTSVHVTNVSFTLANCGECPCNPLP